MTDKQPFIPDWTLRPGILLRDLLRGQGTSDAELAVLSGIHYPVMLAVLDGTARIDEEMALRIGLATGTPQGTWLRAQEQYEADLARGATDLSKEHEGGEEA